MMGFNVVKSDQELQDHIKGMKDVWGVRRGAAVRNTIMVENRLFHYPVFAAIQPSVDHHRSFHIITIICTRRTAKRLVYWKTSKKRLSNKPLYRQPSVFYVMENKESLMEYFSKVDEDFYKWINTFAERAEDCEIVVDDQAFHSAREEVVKLMKISKHPFMINSFKVGVKDRGREDRIKYFLKHFVIQLKDAKRLVYWKKDHYPSKTGEKKSFERPSYFIAANKLPTLRTGPTPRSGRPRGRSYDGGEWSFGWNRPERPERNEEDRPERPERDGEDRLERPERNGEDRSERENGLAETTLRGMIQPIGIDYEIYSDHRAPASRTFYANTTVPVDNRNIATGRLAGDPVEVRQMDDEVDGETEEVQVEGMDRIQVDVVGEEVRRGDWVREDGIAEEDERNNELTQEQRDDIQARDEVVNRAINLARTNRKNCARINNGNDENAEDGEEA